jgi:hypothetical protein
MCAAGVNELLVEDVGQGRVHLPYAFLMHLLCCIFLMPLLCCVPQVSMSFWLKMSGGDVYELRTEAVLYVTPRLAMSVEDFYAHKVRCS